MNWGEENDWDNFTFTDENGSYAIGNLEPGLYNIAVLMEDENLQDLALRPDSDPTLFSRTLYVPGFTPVVLETDNRSREEVVWCGVEVPEMLPDFFGLIHLRSWVDLEEVFMEIVLQLILILSHTHQIQVLEFPTFSHRSK